MVNVIIFIILSIVIVLSVVAIILSVISYARYNIINARYENFMTGKDAESLEDFFIDLQTNVDLLSEENQKNKENIKKLSKILKKTFQKYGIHKYDAFDEKTGKRSFVISLLDFTNTGFVITCQSSGDGTILFIKEVDAGTTETKLGPEEQIALEIALGQRSKE